MIMTQPQGLAINGMQLGRDQLYNVLILYYQVTPQVQSFCMCMQSLKVCEKDAYISSAGAMFVLHLPRWVLVSLSRSLFGPDIAILVGA